MSLPDHPFISRLLPRLEALVRQAAPATNPPATGLLVALSGGPDSVALLYLARARAAATGAPLAATRLNHRLRGADADADESFCRELCARLGVPLQDVTRADPRPLARRRGLGLEEAGRVLRRRLLLRLLAARPELACAATGHHRDDQTETVIMRLFRGAGLDGMRGIRPVAGRIIHPLLAADRQEILAFLEALGQPWRRTSRTPTVTPCARVCGANCCRWRATSSAPAPPAGRRGWPDCSTTMPGCSTARRAPLSPT